MAALAGVSYSTFARWMKRHQSEISLYGVSRTSHLLPPQAVHYICQQYGIDEEELIHNA